MSKSIPKNRKKSRIISSLPGESAEIALRPKEPPPVVALHKLNSLSHAMDQIESDRESAMRSLELYVNSRPRSTEYDRLAKMLNYWVDLNTHERDFVTWEELAEMFKLEHSTLIAALSGGIYESSLAIAKVGFARGMPEVASAVIQRASGAKGGTADAKLALQVTGMLVEGPSVQINNNQTTQVAVPPTRFIDEVHSLDEMIRAGYEKIRNQSVDGEILDIKGED